MAEVKVQEGESIESALRRFKRKVQQEDIIKDIKKHSFYLKHLQRQSNPSVEPAISSTETTCSTSPAVR